MTKHTYTKEDFERMGFEIEAARKHQIDGALYWFSSPQGHGWWADAFYGRDGSDTRQRAELQNMVQQYDALYGEVQS